MFAQQADGAQLRGGSGSVQLLPLMAFMGFARRTEVAGIGLENTCWKMGGSRGWTSRGRRPACAASLRQHTWAPSSLVLRNRLTKHLGSREFLHANGTSFGPCPMAPWSQWFITLWLFLFLGTFLHSKYGPFLPSPLPLVPSPLDPPPPRRLPQGTRPFGSEEH